MRKLVTANHSLEAKLSLVPGLPYNLPDLVFLLDAIHLDSFKRAHLADLHITLSNVANAERLMAQPVRSVIFHAPSTLLTPEGEPLAACGAGEITHFQKTPLLTSSSTLVLAQAHLSHARTH